MSHDAIAASNRAAWNAVAGKYAPEVAGRVARLRAGERSLLAAERDALRLGDGWCACAVHLQCSFGLDTLSLWAEGAARVVGVDVSEAMLALAQSTGDALGAPATWIRADVLELPHALRGAADLVYTGKGALPWVMDIARWAAGVAATLRPGGLLYVYEGHPLDWVWDPEAPAYVPRAGGAGYFERAPRENTDFPASYLARAGSATPGAGPPRAYERQWTLGEVVNAVLGAGLQLEGLDEYPDPFWPLYPHLAPEVLRLLPHAYALRARRPAPGVASAT